MLPSGCSRTTWCDSNLAPEHCQPLLHAAQDGRETFRYTDVPGDDEAMQAYVARAIAGRDAGEMLPFAVIDQSTGTAVGSTRFCYSEYFRWPDADRPRPADASDAAQIGYTWLAGSAQRSGINRAAKLLLLTVAFDEWRLVRVTLRTDARNDVSRAAIEALGAHLDGVLRASSVAYDAQGVRDSAVYSVLASEWPKVRRRLEPTAQP